MNLISKCDSPLRAEFKIPARPRRSAFGNSIFLNDKISRNDVPFRACHWRGLFTDWLSELFHDARKAGAPLFPEPGSTFAQLQDLVDGAALREQFHLSDPSVATFWLEFLAEHPSRVDWWRRFLRVNGPCEVL